MKFADRSVILIVESTSAAPRPRVAASTYIVNTMGDDGFISHAHKDALRNPGPLGENTSRREVGTLSSSVSIKLADVIRRVFIGASVVTITERTHQCSRFYAKIERIDATKQRNYANFVTNRSNTAAVTTLVQLK